MNIKNNRLIRGVYFFFKNYLTPSKGSFGSMGKNVIITPPGFWGNPSNVFIGDNVGIGPQAMVSATRAKFIIKGKCAIAEGLTVHTGNHVRVHGKFVTDIVDNNKPDGNDKDVIIEEDVWIGSNVTILSGVTIGRGTTIAAGALVNRSIPPYCVAAGVPARVVKFYWTIDEIIEHEKILYNESERLSIDYLEQLIK